jgi:hypothetical protein
MKCIMCGCDIHMKDTEKLATISYDDYCHKLGFCKEECFNELDDDDKHDIEFNYLFNNLIKNSNKKKYIYNNIYNGKKRNERNENEEIKKK